MKPVISTARRIEYARGYLGLGMWADASDELEKIKGADRRSPDVLEVLTAIHMDAQHWELAATAASQLAIARPDDPQGWISWAFAVRRCKGIASAEPILLEAEKRFGDSCALVHYNLACYRCQQGDLAEAERRLAVACRMERNWKAVALGDPDLEPIRERIRHLPEPG